MTCLQKNQPALTRPEGKTPGHERDSLIEVVTDFVELVPGRAYEPTGHLMDNVYRACERSGPQGCCDTLQMIPAFLLPGVRKMPPPGLF